MVKKYFYITLSFVFFTLISILVTNGSRPSVLSFHDSRLTVFGKQIAFNKRANTDVKLKQLTDSISSYKGTYSFYIKNLTTGVEYKYKENDQYYAASVYKLPIAVAVIKEIENGNLSYDHKIKYLPADYTTGSGSIYYLQFNSDLTVDELLDKLLKDSDNIAQNMLLRSIKQKTVQDTFNLIGIPNNQFYSHNIASPKVVSAFIENLVLSNYINPENMNKLILKMVNTSFDDRITTGLSSEDRFAHKIGNWGEAGSWHDCGLVIRKSFNIAVCLMSKNTTFAEFAQVGRQIGEFIDSID